MRFRTLFVLSASATLLSSSFAAADFDFSPYVSGGKILIGGHDDEEGTDVSVLRTGSYSFGENPDDPYNTGDPGFNTNGATAFKGGSSLNLTGRAVGGVFLRYWDGNGSPNFVPAAAGTTLRLADSPAVFATFSAGAVAYTPGTASSLFIDTFANNGALHRHLTSSLFQNGLQASGSVPAGEYLVSLTLSNPNGNGVAMSDTTFALFNNGVSDDQADAAVDYVNRTYVPEPAALGMLAAGGALALRRRRVG